MSAIGSEPSAEPTAFEVYVSDFAGLSYGAWWTGEEVIYESFTRGYKDAWQTRLTPSRVQWQRFWRSIDELKVWGWLPRYEAGERFEPRGIVRDGVHWSLTLAHAGRRVESSGDSAGPGAVDLDESSSFTSFADAVSRLLGGRAFS